jgi:hypothetical protein
VRNSKSNITFKQPVANILKQLMEDKKDIQQKIRSGQFQELKVKYKVVKPL